MMTSTQPPGRPGLVDQEVRLRMEQAELKRRIDSFDRWHYQFDFGGVTTPIFDKTKVNRHEQRARYFFDALVALCGGSLEGKRVLDLGCNAGFWSLKAINAGADHVVGLDGRQTHVDQSNLVFEASGIDPSRYQFAVADVTGTDLSVYGSFDIVLCLGLLYHVSKPFELFERFSAVNTDIVVVDTEVSAAAGSKFEVKHEAIEELKNAVDRSMVLLPTRQAVVELGEAFGYKVVPLKLAIASFEGMPDYRVGERIAFIGAKQTSLASVASAPVAPPLGIVETGADFAVRRARWALNMLRNRPARI